MSYRKVLEKLRGVGAQETLNQKKRAKMMAGVVATAVLSSAAWGGMTAYGADELSEQVVYENGLLHEIGFEENVSWWDSFISTITGDDAATTTSTVTAPVLSTVVSVDTTNGGTEVDGEFFVAKGEEVSLKVTVNHSALRYPYKLEGVYSTVQLGFVDDKNVMYWAELRGDTYYGVNEDGDEYVLGTIGLPVDANLITYDGYGAMTGRFVTSNKVWKDPDPFVLDDLIDVNKQFYNEATVVFESADGDILCLHTVVSMITPLI